MSKEKRREAVDSFLTATDVEQTTVQVFTLAQRRLTVYAAITNWLKVNATVMSMLGDYITKDEPPLLDDFKESTEQFCIAVMRLEEEVQRLIFMDKLRRKVPFGPRVVGLFLEVLLRRASSRLKDDDKHKDTRVSLSAG